MARRWNHSFTPSVHVPEEQKIAFSPYTVWRAKKLKQPVESKIITVKCMGKMHKIHMRFPGPISLLNHTKAQDDLLMKLGGPESPKPECLIFLEQWKSEPYQVAATRPWVKVYLRARQDFTAIRTSAKNQYSDWLSFPLLRRLEHWIEVINSHLINVVNKKRTPALGMLNQPTVWSPHRGQYTKKATRGDFIQPRVRLSFESAEWDRDVTKEDQ